MSSNQSEERTMFFTREKKQKSNHNRERCFFKCEKNDMFNQKPQRCVSFAPEFPPVTREQVWRSGVQTLASTPYVGWVCCWFSPLLREVFLQVLWFSPLLKNQHFQIPIRSGTHGHVSASSYELLSAPWVNKLQFTILQALTACSALALRVASQTFNEKRQ